MVFPVSTPPGHSVLSQSPISYWSAFGPRVDNLLYKVYNDFTGMFSDFQAGQLDITDWPVQPADLSSFINNPDFFVSTRQGPGGIFYVDINHQDPLFNVATPTDQWQTTRTTGTPAVVPIATTSCIGCPANTFQLTIQLQTLEENNAAIKDANNIVNATISGTSSPTVT